jgi:hypothetical protein
MRNGAKELADKVGDASVSDITWNLWINQGIESLYKTLAKLYPDTFFKTVDFTLAGGAGGNSFDVRTIPDADYGFIRYVERDPGTTNRRRVRRFNLAEKDAAVGARNLSIWCPTRRYRKMGNELFVEPYEQAAGNYRLYYVPRPAPLAETCDAVDAAIDPWAEYPQVFAAMKALGKEESDTGPLATRMRELKAEIQFAATDDDEGESDVIADVEDFGDDRW